MATKTKSKPTKKPSLRRKPTLDDVLTTKPGVEAIDELIQRNAGRRADATRALAAAIEQRDTELPKLQKARNDALERVKQSKKAWQAAEAAYGSALRIALGTSHLWDARIASARQVLEETMSDEVAGFLKKLDAERDRLQSPELRERQTFHANGHTFHIGIGESVSARLLALADVRREVRGWEGEPDQDWSARFKELWDGLPALQTYREARQCEIERFNESAKRIAEYERQQQKRDDAAKLAQAAERREMDESPFKE